MVSCQTYTVCDPLKVKGCQPCKALGKKIYVNFTEGASPLFLPVASPEQIRYTQEGVEFILSKPGHNPTLQSDFYIMFGRIEVILKASKGKGIVSSFVLQSDTLDEIDLEWIGEDTRRFQSNFFSKGDTSSYDRGEFHLCQPPQDAYHNYTIDWTDKNTIWYYDNQEVRRLPGESPSGYPQTPMAIRIGSWAGGDPSNPPGTIEWAGGLTDYSKGPFVFTVKSLLVKDYSTGFEYAYGDQSGTWMSIQALGGEIKGEYQNNDINWSEYEPEPSYKSLHLGKDSGKNLVNKHSKIFSQLWTNNELKSERSEENNLDAEGDSVENNKHADSYENADTTKENEDDDSDNENTLGKHRNLKNDVKGFVGNIFTSARLDDIKGAFSSLTGVAGGVDQVSISAFKNEKYPETSPFPVVSTSEYNIIQNSSTNGARYTSVIGVVLILTILCMFF
ncbi:Crh1p [Sugiyamaella lignohabitans]|uniref:Crh1p n=1 Tax=Sugiyamaella lignohabitans TaxID=796027 RepID=A0A167DPH4_9ASCO|nr:Crh1p [Sugiyamaella lignohabitans]ANB13139.1 Crh1p [Sugiyamaella lignohabitans]